MNTQSRNHAPRRRGSGALLAALGLASTAHAGPTGGTVVAGQGDISRPQASTTVVQQRSRAMAINWDTFNVRPDEVVRFNQPSASASHRTARLRSTQ